MPYKPSIRVEQDRSDGSWIVVRYRRHGWNVLHRCESHEQAMDEAQREVQARRDFAMEGR